MESNEWQNWKQVKNWPTYSPFRDIHTHRAQRIELMEFWRCENAYGIDGFVFAERQV